MSEQNIEKIIEALAEYGIPLIKFYAIISIVGTVLSLILFIIIFVLITKNHRDIRKMGL